MKPSSIVVALALVVGGAGPPAAAQLNQTNQPPSAEQAEAAYTRTIEKRAADVVAALRLKDPTNAAKVHDILIAQYRALHDWHDTNDARLKKAATDEAQQLNASLKSIHDKFVAALAAVLTPDQVDIVKDRMTYSKVKVTYNAYCETYPKLTDAQKQKVLELLKEAREEAMNAGSSEEKNKVFRKFKGRINNYLIKEGYDSKQADKEPGETGKSGALPEKAE